INWLITNSENKGPEDTGLLNSGTGIGHHWGVQFFNLALWHDRYFSRSRKNLVKGARDQGIKFARSFVLDNRINPDYRDHNWDTDRSNLSENELFQSCDKWEENYSKCEGCRFR